MAIPFVIFSSLIAHAANAVLTNTGQTFILNDIPYYIPGTPLTKLAPFRSLGSITNTGGLVPVTIVDVSSSASSNTSTLETVIDGFGVDDVWNNGFLEGQLSDETCCRP